MRSNERVIGKTTRVTVNPDGSKVVRMDYLTQNDHAKLDRWYEGEYTSQKDVREPKNDYVGNLTEIVEE